MDRFVMPRYLSRSRRRTRSTSCSDAVDEVRALCALPSSPSFGRDRRLIVGWEAEAAVLAKRVENILRREGIASFSRVVALQEHDNRHGTTLVETLATYYGCVQRESCFRCSRHTPDHLALPLGSHHKYFGARPCR